VVVLLQIGMAYNQRGSNPGSAANFNLRGSQWSLLNSANVVLLPKKEDAAYPADFRPISLMHSVAKILTKLLANRLAPLLPNMVSPCQRLRALSSKGVFKITISISMGKSTTSTELKPPCSFSSSI
jgi:hypothetical protein